MDKADILEMAVEYVKKTREQVAEAGSTGQVPVDRYRAGFNACADVLQGHLDQFPQVSNDCRARLMDHLANFIQNKQWFAHHLQNACLPLQFCDPSVTQTSPTSSTTSNVSHTITSATSTPSTSGSAPSSRLASPEDSDATAPTPSPKERLSGSGGPLAINNQIDRFAHTSSRYEIPDIPTRSMKAERSSTSNREGNQAEPLDLSQPNCAPSRNIYYCDPFTPTTTTTHKNKTNIRKRPILLDSSDRIGKRRLLGSERLPQACCSEQDKENIIAAIPYRREIKDNEHKNNNFLDNSDDPMWRPW